MCGIDSVEMYADVLILVNLMWCLLLNKTCENERMHANVSED